MKYIIILCCILATSCTTMTTDVDFDQQATFNNMRQYTWLQSSKSYTRTYLGENRRKNTTSKLSSTDNKDFTPLIQKRIKQQIDNKLKNAGFKRVQNGQEDFLVRFSLTTYERQKIYSDDYNLGYYHHRPYYGWHSRDYDIYYYDEGLLVVEIIDPKAKQVIWIGRISNISSNDLNANSDEFDKALNELLNQFPPHKSLVPQ